VALELPSEAWPLASAVLEVLETADKLDPLLTSPSLLNCVATALAAAAAAALSGDEQDGLTWMSASDVAVSSSCVVPVCPSVVRVCSFVVRVSECGSEACTHRVNRRKPRGRWNRKNV
jgi:hypothetical protein